MEQSLQELYTTLLYMEYQNRMNLSSHEHLCSVVNAILYQSIKNNVIQC